MTCLLQSADGMGKSAFKVWLASLYVLSIGLLVCYTYQCSCSDHPYTWHSIPLFCLQPTFQEPHIQIDDAALDSWKRGQLAKAETLLTTAVNKSRNPSHHALASRALVRARLHQWDAAFADARKVFVVALLSRALMLI